jgi:hypothetical protein
MPARAVRRVRDGHEPRRELSALTRLVRPHVAIVTTIAPAHIGHFSGEEGIADAKGEIFEGLEPGGVAIIPADNRHYERLRAKAAQHAGTIIAFGRAAHADVRLLDVVPAPGGGSLVTADLGDRKLCYTVAQPGDHWVINSLAVMAAVQAAGGDLGAAGLALAEMAGLAGRGARHTLAAPGGDGSGHALLIDESYNANPASMVATLAELGKTPPRGALPCSARCASWARTRTAITPNWPNRCSPPGLPMPCWLAPKWRHWPTPWGKAAPPRLQRLCKSIMCKPVPRPPMCWRGSALRAGTRSSSRVRIRLVWARW